MDTRWAPGDSVAVRHSGTGGVRFVEPATVVRDDGRHVVLYRPEGTQLKVPPSFAFRRSPKEREAAALRELMTETPSLSDAKWEHTDVLVHAAFGDWYSTWLFWSSADHSFLGYYVNFELPWRRSSIGFDTNDLTIDLVVAPDLSWRWKDEEEYENRMRLGVIPKRWADGVAAARAEVLAKIESAAPPFDGSLNEFEPDPSWPKPTVPPDWNARPVVRGRIKFFKADKGWGGIESEGAPDDVWVHFGHVSGSDRNLKEGDEVEFTYELANQDSWRYRTLSVRKLSSEG